MICRSDIANVKTDIGELVGHKVLVRAALGRNKTSEKHAVVEKAYPNIFVVKYDDNERNVTYSYTDLLTKTVQLEVFDGENFNPLSTPTVSAKL